MNCTFPKFPQEAETVYGNLICVPWPGAPGVTVEAASAGFHDQDAAAPATARGAQAPPKASADGAASSEGAVQQDGQLLALQLRFQLPSSTYATMAIRQVRLIG